MIKTKPEAIIFDWDNTLVDTIPHIKNARDSTLQKYLPNQEPKETKILSSSGGRQSFFMQFGDQAEEAGKFFLESYKQSTINGVDPLDQAQDVLECLSQTDVPLVIVSNKLNLLLNKEIGDLGWMKYFKKIIGSKDAPLDKPNPEPVYLALEPLGITASPKVWLIGDSTIDVKCAFNANCLPILFGDKKEFDEEEFKEQDILHIEDHSSLKRLFEQYFF